MTLIPGVDVSNYQSTAQTVGAVKAGARFVIVKASEGLSYIDPDHGAHVAAARSAGASVGHYHFASPSNDPLAEARFFLGVAKPQPGDVVALDLEADAAGQVSSWQRRAAYASSFLSYVNAATHARCLWYTNRSWLVGVLNAASTAQRSVLDAAPLWIAAPGTPGQPGTVQPWAVHQFGVVGGLDRDVLAVPWASLTGVAPTSSTVTSGAFMALTDAQQQQMYDWLRILDFGFDNGNPIPFSSKGELTARIRAIQAAVPTAAEIAAAVVAALPPAQSASVDPTVLAKAVADELERRLAG